ncbi:Phosphoribosyl 1,2-cyclic phosphodiesterase [Chishuiella changwenlii]|uniref:MBL fold metallo-hydrolase n=1 Tax=Chishuiella changwenlii TaxID=1434701 RepID=A0A1M6XBT3_9FLAO|nr:MBL fold metallo-hydrolase [Chishuiella changwenlii]GGF00364.1 MBL fold metallo-hydrolase [Chishuiella changwenlii]SHL03368.1 Phosphoribosyl 1,2-cyclic phosphodiesterase [Chishuiella changwenlii]
MQLKILGTGSSGNCYILENENEALIIELGLHFSKIKQSLDFDLSKVVGTLITHEHGDHAGEKGKGIKDALSNGIKVYSSAGTFRAFDIKHHNANIIQAKKSFQIGNFKILPFNVHHDVNEPLGFLIEHEETGRILFVTDTTYIDYTFPNLNNIIIEANYCEDIIKEKLGSSWQSEFLKNRILKSHMSLNTCKQTLLANDLSQVQKIVLIHLSDSNSDERKFKKVIEEATGKIVHVANNNQTLDFNKNPF